MNTTTATFNGTLEENSGNFSSTDLKNYLSTLVDNQYTTPFENKSENSGNFSSTVLKNFPTTLVDNQYTTPFENKLENSGNFSSTVLKNFLSTLVDNQYTTPYENQSNNSVGNYTSDLKSSNSTVESMFTALFENQSEKTSVGNIMSSNATRFMNTTQDIGHEDYVTTLGNLSLHNISGKNSTNLEDQEAGYLLPCAVWIFLIILLLAIMVWACCKRHVLHIMGFRKAGPKSGTCAACWQSCYGGEIPPNSLFSNLQSNAMK